MKTDDGDGVQLQAMQYLTSHFDNQDVKLDELLTQIRQNCGMKLHHN